MSRLCLICNKHIAQLCRGRYCRPCYRRCVKGRGAMILPESGPFIEERNLRIERMRQRAERRLPIFEEVQPDLS